jgi:SAM-dependent methyltransferase
MSQKKRVLNVGGGHEAINLPAQYAGFEVLRLDIDPAVAPDVLCDARELARLDAGQFDAIYCAHNLEHYYRHEVPKVLAGFLHVLKDGGFAHVIVPDIEEVMRVALERGLDLEDMLYNSPAGPITVRDVIWGWSVEIERTGQDFFAHKTGFTPKSLLAVVEGAGFAKVYRTTGNYEAHVLAFKSAPDAEAMKLFGLPDA